MKTILTVLLLFITTLCFSQVVEKDGFYYGGDGNLFSGNHKELYSDGKVKIEMSIARGQLHGITQLYFPTGQINEVRSYTSGKMDGKWETYNN